MRLKAIALIPRIDGVFQLREALITRSWGFRGFTVEHVEAIYRKDDPIDGYAVALILESSQVDTDFRVPTVFLAQSELESICEAMEESDMRTEAILKRGWKGARPYLKLHHFM